MIFHANCNDGFAAALVAHLHLDAAEFLPASYGDPPPDVSLRDILILDFSYPRADLVRLAAANHSVTVLDHHKTAAMDLAFLPDAPTAETWRASLGKGVPMPLTARFDMNRSGAGMAWDWFSSGESRPALIAYVEDRDLWRFADRDTRAVHAALAAYDLDFRVWYNLMLSMDEPDGLLEIVDEGQVLLRMHDKRCRELIAQTRRMAELEGFAVPVCNVPHAFASDVGNLLCQEDPKPPFAATYVDTAKGRHVSLRSTDAGVDVSEIAKKFGGGGHRNAAGFSLSLTSGVTWPA